MDQEIPRKIPNRDNVEKSIKIAFLQIEQLTRTCLYPTDKTVDSLVQLSIAKDQILNQIKVDFVDDMHLNGI